VTATQVAAQLRTEVDAAVPFFLAVDESRTTVPVRAGGWCARQILGHLIDSACNNHRRFVMAQSADFTKFDGYEQDAWVDRQRYDTVAWRDLVALWAAYNRHLAHVMTRIPDEAATRSAASPDGGRQITLSFVVEDYVVHLRHHLDQIANAL
jgi:hypothetical protein